MLEEADLALVNEDLWLVAEILAIRQMKERWKRGWWIKAL
jgi:hypothetical protein